MLETDRSVVGTQQLALQQGNDSMNTRQQIGWRFLVTSKKGDPVAVAILFEGIVPEPRICMHDAARLDRVEHKRHQARGRSVCDSPHPNPANTPSVLLRRHHDQGFPPGLSTPLALFRTAKVSFVHLHRARQPIAARLIIARRNLCSQVQAVW